MLYSFSLYIYTQFFFCKHVSKINKKKVIAVWILCQRCVWYFYQRDLEGYNWVKEADKNDWVNIFVIIS